MDWNGALAVRGVEVEVGVSLIQSRRHACGADFAHSRSAPSNAGSVLPVGYEMYEKKYMNIYQMCWSAAWYLILPIHLMKHWKMAAPSITCEEWF